MSSTSQQQKDASSSNSTQPSMSSAASGSNNCAKMEDKASQGKRPRGPRTGSKRHLNDAGQKQQQQRQLIRYNRDALLQMRDSRLSTAWPRALDRSFVGDSGLWDPVKLFEGERKSVFEGKTKIERVRNVRSGAMQQSYSSGPSAEDGQSFGRSSRRRKRTKEEAASPATSSMQRQRGWPPAAASATEASSASSTQQPPTSEKENKKELHHRDEVARGFGLPRLGSAGGGFGRRSDRPAVAGTGVFGSGRGGPANGRWERSQGLRDQHGGRGGFQAPRHRAADEEELPAWFDEAPLDKMEKLELTGLPEDMEAAEGDGGSKQAAAAPGAQEPQQPPQPFDGLLLGGGGSDVGGASSRFAKWLSMDEPPQPQPQPPATEAAQRGGAQQQLERIFQDMRGRSGPETKQPQEAAAAASPTVGPSLMHLLRPQPKSEPPRPLHAQEVEASLKSMLFGSETPAPPPAAATAAAAVSSGGSAMPVLPPNGQARTLEEIESSLGAASGGSDRGSRGSKDSRAIYKLIGDLQVQMHDSAAGPVVSRQASVPPLLPASRQAQQQPPQQPQSKPLQPTAPPFIAQHTLPPRSQPPPPQQQPTAPPMFSSGAGSQAAAAAAQRRLPMPLQAQQLQQLQAMLLSNLQMQTQMMHGGQHSSGSANKSHPLNKLLPQTFRWYRAMNNALQGTRLLNQQFTGQTGAADFTGFEAAAGADAAAFRRPNASAAAAAATSSACHQPVAQPAMPIVPPMLLPPKTSSASSSAAAAGLQGWGGAHNQQLSAMLWNATRLAASVKSANPSVGWGLHCSPPVDSGVGQPHRAPPTKPVDEMPSA